MATVVEWGLRPHVEAHEGAMDLDSGAESSWQVKHLCFGVCTPRARWGWRGTQQSEDHETLRGSWVIRNVLISLLFG